MRVNLAFLVLFVLVFDARGGGVLEFLELGDGIADVASSMSAMSRDIPWRTTIRMTIRSSMFLGMV